MKNKRNKEKLGLNNILYLVGFAILIFGLISTLINKQITSDRKKTLGVIEYIENKDITLSNGTIENKTMYHIAYNTLDGEIIRYIREKKPLEDFEVNDMLFIYYLEDFPEDKIEETKKIDMNSILILFGASIVLTNLSLMMFNKEQEKKEKIQKNINNNGNLSFKLDKTMLENIQEDVKMKETSLIDDEIEQINKEYNEKSLLEKHLINSSKVGTAYDANGNPINLQNNQLNTGSLVNGNTLHYGNNQVYGQNPNQGNYYGNSTYNNYNNYNYNDNNNNNFN